jgi:hypothetical protein
MPVQTFVRDLAGLALNITGVAFGPGATANLIAWRRHRPRALDYPKVFVL